MGLTFIAIALLGVAWAFLLVPDLLGRRGAPRRSNSVTSFRDHLSGLDRTRPAGTARGSAPTVSPRPLRTSSPAVTAPTTSPGPRTVRPRPAPAALSSRSSIMPRSRAEAARRRTTATTILAVFALVSLVAGLVISPALLLVHLVADALLGGFVYLSWERASRSRTRRSSLVSMHGRSAGGATRSEGGGAVITPLRREASGS